MLLICSAVGVVRHALDLLLASSRRKCSEQRLDHITSSDMLQWDGEIVA